MRWKPALILLAIAAFLAGINGWAGYARRHAQREQATAGQLISFPLREVKGFTLHRADGAVVECQRRDDAWRLVRPVDDRPSRNAIEEVLALVSYGHALDRGRVSDAEAGFEGEISRLVVRGKDRSQEIRFGGRTGRGRDLYVRLPRRPGVTFLIDAGLAAFLERPVLSFRDLDIFSLSMTDVDSILLRGVPGGTIAMDRIEGGWILTEPSRWPADGDRVETILEHCASMAARKVLAERVGDPAGYGLGKEAVGIELRTEDGRVQSVRLGPPLEPGGDDGVAVAGDRDQLFAVPDALRKLLAREPAVSYRQRRLDPLAGMKALSEIRIDRPGGTVRLVHRADSWVGLAPRKFSADTGVMERLVLLLERLQVERFADDLPGMSDEERGLQPPETVVRAYGVDRKEAVALRIGTPTDAGDYYAALPDTPDAFTISEIAGQFFNQPWYTFNNRQILYFGMRDVDRMTIRQPGEATVVYQRTVGDAWQMAEPRTVPADAIRLYTSLLSQDGLGNLRALAFVGTTEQDLDKFGLDRPYLSVVVEFSLPVAEGRTRDISRTIVVGDAVAVGEGKARYARLEDGDLVFLIDDAVVEMLLKDYSNPEALE
jgi:hypothetical protein